MLSSIFSEKMSFFVAGTPRPKGSFEMKVNADTGSGHLYNPTKTKMWQEVIQNEAEKQWNNDMLFKGIPVGLKCTFYLRRPKTVKAKERPYMIMVPDLDKLVRTVGDALTKIVYEDDKQVTDIAIKKRYIDYRSDQEEGVDIEIQW